MSVAMSAIRHPGLADEPRVLAEPCRVETFSLSLAPGARVLQSVSAALGGRGIESAVVEITGGRIDPLVYVMPALSDDGIHAAWYSATHAPDGPAEIEAMTFTYGRLDCAPFLHCHGVWRLADGTRVAGHILPDRAQFAEPVEALVHAVSGAILEQREDSETKFRLFTPVTNATASPDGRRALLCRIKPHQDVLTAIEVVAREHEIENATLHGVGSLIDCTFIDGDRMDSIASELFIREGRVQSRDGAATASLDIAIVGIEGDIHQGRITRGNPVCVTFELLIAEEA